MNTYTYLQKNSDAKAKNTHKYYLEFCEQRVKRGDIPTKDWLVIKDIVLDKKVIRAVNNNKSVIVKIGEETKIKKDYWLSKYLFNNNNPGFIRYICQFECHDDVNKYKMEPDSDDDDSFCSTDNKLPMVYSLVMPYIPLGSIKNYKWTKRNVNILKSLLSKAVQYYIMAAKKTGFIHNDFHADNIMMLSLSDVCIIDLELAELYRYTEKKKPLEKVVAKDMRKLFSSLNDIKLNINTGHVILKLNDIMDSFNDTDLDSLYEILPLIDRIEIIT